MKAYNPNGGIVLASEFFNPFPKYLQVRSILIRRLAAEFSPGDRLPTEHALCEEFGVSRDTIREALQGLESEGLIRRQRGQGTFLVRLPAKPRDERVTGLVEDFTELKRNTSTRILESSVVRPPSNISDALRVRGGEPLYRIQRLRVLDNEPFAHHDAFLPVEIGIRLSRLDLRRTTLFREIQDTLGITVYEEYQHIDAIVADTDVAALLNIPVGAPLLVVRRVLAEGGAGPAMFFQTHFRSDRYYYTVQRAQPARKRETVNAKAPRRRAG